MALLLEIGGVSITASRPAGSFEDPLLVEGAKVELLATGIKLLI